MWQLSGREDHPLPIPTEPSFRGDLREARAHWLDERTIAWDVDATGGDAYALHVAPDADLAVSDDDEGVRLMGGSAVPLEHVAEELPDALADRFPHLAGLDVLRVPTDLDVPAALRAQLAVSRTTDGVLVDATAIQLPGVLDDLFTTDAPLGVTWDAGAPTLSVWAPTATDVRLLRFDRPGDADPRETLAMTRDAATGVWSVTGDRSWDRAYYLYEVDVYAPSVREHVTNRVTDPYSVSLAADSVKSQIVDLDAPDLAPRGWSRVGTTMPDSTERLDVYELHVRDFSIADTSVPERLRGTYLAFTVSSSRGMRHLRSLAAAGIDAVHLLPVFDVATIPERRADQVMPDIPVTYAPDSEVPQERVADVKDVDGFNWGYDPYHYTTPEGSYATEPDGVPRIRELRAMVGALDRAGLGVVMDVVYNHTHAAGQDERSVLDRIVPGYYHRLLEDGSVATSTCCQNTATEHAMMERLMVDSIVTWARHYKVDGFRFDLMGHHSKANMLAVRAALDALTVERDGVDGPRIAIYGEGWSFGEVADDARFEQATQANMAGTGVGTFNDRLRDAVRGGGPFDADPRIQGFASGAYTDPNGAEVNGTPAQQLERLLLDQDRIRVGLAGNLAGYELVDRTGATVTGADVDYDGSPTGYTADPRENVVYVSAHDNETLFDALALKLPQGTSMADRVRMQHLGLATVVLAQGISFLHAGSEILRSKSLDRDSYDSGDHFNAIDWTYRTNGFGEGLPLEEVNAERWPFMRPLLADVALQPERGEILAAWRMTRDLLAVADSTPLFALPDAATVQRKLAFHNTGPDQTPGLIVMHLDDTVGADLDRELDHVVVVFNATPDTLEVPAPVAAELELHERLADGSDRVVRGARARGGLLTVPARTVAVFVARQDDG